jgi:two-component system response regulator FlrC
MSGMDLLSAVRTKLPSLPVVMMTAFPDTQLAVQALKLGARDFLIKPFLPDQLLEVIARHAPRVGLAPDRASSTLIAADPASLAVLDRCNRVARTDASVLLTGQSGVGKDVFARYIHDDSVRKDKPFVALNCAAIPDTLLEATLFGYEKGAFTGAVRSQPGKFEQADGGTIFLDEIGEMPKDLQAKLLRVLQDRVIERLGANRSTKCDVRIISATNQDLAAQVKQGAFREDLFFRLAVINVPIPPLKERPGDILPLADLMLERYGRTMGRAGMTLSVEAAAALQEYDWPGNVRELENTIQRALLMTNGPKIMVADLELRLLPSAGSTVGSPAGINLASVIGISKSAPREATDIATVEREHILKVLAQAGGNRRKAADLLGMSERGLRYKLRAYEQAGHMMTKD